ncbi:MAG: hypothetical protein H6Q63_1071 [Firmicutes bacterium]|nr:hypothetical protein [Bacillota bacterium]
MGAIGFAGKITLNIYKKVDVRVLKIVNPESKTVNEERGENDREHDLNKLSFCSTHLSSDSSFFKSICDTLDVAYNGIIIVDKEENIILANRVVADIAGVEKDELIGKRITQVFPNSLLPRTLESGEPSYGRKIIINGIPVVANYSPVVENGIIQNAICIFQDLSSIEHLYAELDSVKRLLFS